MAGSGWLGQMLLEERPHDRIESGMKCRTIEAWSVLAKQGGHRGHAARARRQKDKVPRSLHLVPVGRCRQVASQGRGIGQAYTIPALGRRPKLERPCYVRQTFCKNHRTEEAEKTHGAANEKSQAVCLPAWLQACSFLANCPTVLTTFCAPS